MGVDISREEQDRFAAQSHNRAEKATADGLFDNEMVKLTGEQVGNRKVPGPDGGVQADEGIRAGSTPEILARLRPAFDTKNGTVTAGNASQINDGAAAVAVMSESRAQALGVKPLAKILSYATSGVAPSRRPGLPRETRAIRRPVRAPADAPRPSHVRRSRGHRRPRGAGEGRSRPSPRRAHAPAAADAERCR